MPIYSSCRCCKQTKVIIKTEKNIWFIRWEIKETRKIRLYDNELTASGFCLRVEDHEGEENEEKKKMPKKWRNENSRAMKKI